MSSNDNKEKKFVVKFGGSSLEDSDGISRAAESIIAEVKKGNKIVVVVSAMGKTTEQLIKAMKDVVQEQGRYSKELDDILSMGERTSARMFSTVLKSRGIKSQYFDPMRDDWPIITDESYGDAFPILDTCASKIEAYLKPLLEEGTVPIIPGFIGRTPSGRITTIGRGGSDTTAFILGRFLKANEIILVTDVDGIMSADPKVVSKPQPVKRISARALAGLSDSGTKFIHKKALKFKPKNINVRVISNKYGNLDSAGTVITGEFQSELDVVKGYQSPMIMATIVGDRISEHPEIIQNITSYLRDLGVEMIGMSANHDSLIFYLPDGGNQEILDKIHKIIIDTKYATAMALKRNLALLRINGIGLENTPGLIGKITKPFYENRMNIYGIFTITSSINVLIEWNDKDKAQNLITQALKI